MTYKERQESLDWALTKTAKLQEELNGAKGLLLAVKTALMMAGKDDAKAGALIRDVLNKE